MQFCDTVTEHHFRKESSKPRNIYKVMQRCALDIFLENALDDGPAFWIFTDKGSKSTQEPILLEQFYSKNWVSPIRKAFYVACGSEILF